VHDAHVEHCISACTKRKLRQVTTKINGNMPVLQYAITKEIQKQPNCKKRPAVKKCAAPMKAIVKKM